MKKAEFLLACDGLICWRHFKDSWGLPWNQTLLRKISSQCGSYQSLAKWFDACNHQPVKRP